MEESRCPVCADRIEAAGYRCRTCLVPHHRDCWRWNAGCGIYACRSRANLAPAPALDLDEARARLAALILTVAVALVPLALTWAGGLRP